MPAVVRTGGPWSHRDVLAGGIRMHVAEALPPGHRAGAELPALVLLVHGLGGTWWTLRHQVSGLAAAGFHAVAVDLRGHGDSDKPPRGYDAWTLAGDVTNLIRALGHSTAVLVGQGEGGFVCWTAAYRRPRGVRALAVLGSAHPLAVRRAVLTSTAQRSALAPSLLADQVPRRPERRLVADGAAAVERMLVARGGRAWVEGPDFAESAATLRTAMLIPRVAHLSLESRRWMVRSQFRADGADFRHAMSGRLPQPVLAVCGDADPYLLPATVAGSRRWTTDLQLEQLPGVGHYPSMEAPERVTDLVAGLASRSS